METITQKQTGEHSAFTYQEITNLVKHNKTLAELIEKLFNKYNDVVVFESNAKFDVEYNIIAYESIGMKNDDCYEGDGWQQSDMEINFEKLFQHYEGTDEDGDEYEFHSGQGDCFNWDKVRISNQKCIVVRDEGDYIAIEIVDTDNMEDGIIDFWVESEHYWG